MVVDALRENLKCELTHQNVCDVKVTDEDDDITKIKAKTPQ